MNFTQSATCNSLQKDVQTTLDEGELRAHHGVEQERVRGYWAVGDLLVEFLGANPPDCDPGNGLRSVRYVER